MNNKIYNKDVIDFLIDDVEDGSVDLIIADPPYNVLDIDWDTFKSEETYFEFMLKWMKIAYDKLRNNGSIYIFNNSYNSARLFNEILKIGYKFKDWIIWYKKDGFNNTKKKFINNQEVILFLTKSEENYTFNADSVRIPYESVERIKHAREKGILKNGKRWFPNPDGKLCTNVWEFPSVRHTTKVNGRIIKTFHPTPKPQEIIDRIINASSNPGDIVMDLFSGSGTTSLSAIKNKRIFIGCEINKEYFKEIERKIKREIKNAS